VDEKETAMRKSALLVIGLAAGLLAMGQTGDRWKGFQRIRTTLEGHEAWYVLPEHPLPGRPWIWKAAFFDWHAAMDSILLSKGMALAYVSVDNQYGSPAALQVWDRWYQYLTDSVGLAKSVALEAISRGALYAYAWARRNPDRVSCIYAETPVCDIRSWPGGKYKGLGGAPEWKELLTVYKISEDSAMHYSDNPFDHLEGLAAWKVPILHLTGIHDSLAPSDENTFVLADRYLRLGGPVTIYPVTAGPQDLHGHHFPITEPGRWADWVLGYSYPVKERLSTDRFMTVRDGLPHVRQRLIKREPVTVAFLGGSITYNPGWRDKTMRWLRERYPGLAVRFIAAGIPSLGSPAHAFRLQRDVLDSGRVDLLFIEAAVNDKGNGVDSLTQVRALEGIVRHARAVNPAMDLVLMSFADEYKTIDLRAGRTPLEVYNHEAVADHYGLPSIDLAHEVQERMDHGEFNWRDDFKDLHPSPFGQELYFSAIRRMLERCLNDREGSPDKSLPPLLDKGSFINGRYAEPGAVTAPAGWTFIPDWDPVDRKGTREGFVHVPVLETTKPDAPLEFAFTGTAVGIAVTAGPDAGIIAWQIDKGPEQTQDLFTQWSAGLYLPWYCVLGQALKPGSHVLRLRVLDQKNTASQGTACRIVHFLINQ
jgi:sialidase-1